MMVTRHPFLLFARIPYGLHIFGGPLASYISIVFNILIFVILRDKTLRSPSTVIMQGLAVADSITAFCMFGLEPMFSFYYTQLRLNVNFSSSKEDEKANMLVSLDYPFCIIHFCMNNLSDNFHLVSVLLTGCLGFHKVLVILFPIWSRIKITITKSIIVCVTCYVISMTMNIPRLFVVTFKSDVDETCFTTDPNELLERYILIVYPILYASVLGLTIIVMIISTSFILFTLCRPKKNLRKSISFAERKSCTLITYVLVVFLLTEIPRLYLNAVIVHTYQMDFNENNIFWRKLKIKIDDQLQSDFDICLELRIQELSLNPQLVGNRTVIPFSCDNLDRSPLIAHYFESFMKDIQGMMDEATKDLQMAWESNIYLINVYNRLILDFLRTSNQPYTKIFNQYFCRNFQFDGALSSNLLSIYLDCYFVPVLELILRNLDLYMLVSSPFSETLTYMLMLVWGKTNVTFEKFKLLIEILKLFSVLGCASNFIIYTLISKKLREALFKKIPLSKYM